MVKTTSVKVAAIRKLTNPKTKKKYTDFKDWLTCPTNVYTGRHGRIFVKEEGESKIFHYKKSKWENPYTLKKYSLKESLSMYIDHLFKKVGKKRLIYDIYELDEKIDGKELTLGCFCNPQQKNGIPMCHAQILHDLLTKCREQLDSTVEYLKGIDSL